MANPVTLLAAMVPVQAVVCVVLFAKCIPLPLNGRCNPLLSIEATVTIVLVPIGVVWNVILVPLEVLVWKSSAASKFIRIILPANPLGESVYPWAVNLNKVSPACVNVGSSTVPRAARAARATYEF